MSTAKHTPGPWHISTTRSGETSVADSRGINLCVLGDASLFDTLAPDANLIAAAPAMYTLIKDMREAFYVNGTRKALLAVMERSHEIMAQAEGK